MSGTAFPQGSTPFGNFGTSAADQAKIDALGNASTLAYAVQLVGLGTPNAPGGDTIAGPIASSATPYTGPFTAPAQLRVAQVSFDALWDGGDLTITGTDQYRTAGTTDVITSPGSGGGTVQGLVVFDWTQPTTVAWTLGLGATNITIFGGTALGLGSTRAATANAFDVMNGSQLEPATVDTAHGTITTGTPPDGATPFSAFVNFG